MRILLFFALFALICSSQASVFRFLQEEEVSPPPEDNNGLITLNETNSTDNETGTDNEDNETSLNTTDNANANLLNFSKLFDATGTYILLNTNCTIVEYNLTDEETEEVLTTNSSLCVPELMLDVEGNMIDVTFVYPLNASCGNYSDSEVEFTYPYANGIFMNQSAMFTGVFFINNRSVVTWANDTYNESAGQCYAYWSPLNASNDSEASGDSEATNGVVGSDAQEFENNEVLNDTNAEANNTNNDTQASWEGAWRVASYNSTDATADTEVACCVPDSDILVHHQLASDSILFMLRAPDCAACGPIANTVSLHNITIHEGVGAETIQGVTNYMYKMNDQVIVVGPQCYVVYEHREKRVCNETRNETIVENNDTDDEGDE